MAIVASRPSVTTTATKIAENTASGAEADTSTRSFIVKNKTATASVYLAGTNGVATSNGFEWEVAEGPISIDLEPGESLWGIVASGSQVLHVLGGGR